MNIGIQFAPQVRIDDAEARTVMLARYRAIETLAEAVRTMADALRSPLVTATMSGCTVSGVNGFGVSMESNATTVENTTVSQEPLDK